VDALELVGWVGSAVLVWSLLQTRILRLRVINLVGCVILIVYNGAAGVWPMLGLNVVLAVINIYFLRKLLSTRHSDASYAVVEVDADDAYLRYLMARHAPDLATFYPGFDPLAPYGGEAYLVLRDEETVGYVLLHPEADGVARVDVDYVTERFRDFTPGEFVDVVGETKGKGFQGGVKRHGWSGGDATHGSMFHRAPGSIGASSDPSRVWPGHHLPGRMGGDRRTVLNLPVVRVIPEQNLILLRGAIPGAKGGLVLVRKSVKQTKAQQQKAKEGK